MAVDEILHFLEEKKVYADAKNFFVDFPLFCSNTKTWERRSTKKKNQSIKIRKTIQNLFLIFPANIRKKVLITTHNQLSSKR